MVEKVKVLFQSVRYANIATVNADGTPWNSPVWYAYADKTIYWWSPVGSQHSRNISERPDVFITIYDSTVPEGEGFGVYLQATAEEVTESDVDNVMHLFNATTEVFKIKRDDCSGDAPTRFYKATIEKAWVNKDSEINGKFVDIREEIDL